MYIFNNAIQLHIFLFSFFLLILYLPIFSKKDAKWNSIRQQRENDGKNVESEREGEVIVERWEDEQKKKELREKAKKMKETGRKKKKEGKEREWKEEKEKEERKKWEGEEERKEGRRERGNQT